MVLVIICIEKQSIYNTIENYDEAVNFYRLAYNNNPKPEYLFHVASIYQNKMNDGKQALDYCTLFPESLPAKTDSENKENIHQVTVPLKKIAGDNIAKLKEELFFNGKLTNCIFSETNYSLSF